MIDKMIRQLGWRKCNNAFLARELVDWLIENVDVVEKRSAGNVM
jgi:hypothetical protein